MITDTINKEILRALKAKDEIRLSTMRLLATSLHNARIDKRSDLDENEEIAVVQREAKKRKEAIDAIKGAQGKQTTSTPNALKEKLDREEKELVILREFLPKQLSEEELVSIVEEVIGKTGAKSLADMGPVMGEVMKEVAGKADGKIISDIVRNKLS